MQGKDSLNLFSDNKRIGWIISLFIHLGIVLMLLYLPQFIKEKPADAYEGILVSFGLPVESESEENSNSTPEQVNEDFVEKEEEYEDTKEIEEIKSSLIEEESEVKVKKSEKAEPSRKASTKSEEKNEVDPEAELDKAKDAFGKLFKSAGNNSGKQAGDPLGDRDAEILSGISKGKGKVGGGLDARGVMYEPEIVEHSQKSGRVVVKVCVDNEGKVISSKFTQRGSTTTDKDLVEVAEISAKRYKFMPSEFVEQCGTISINFIVR